MSTMNVKKFITELLPTYSNPTNAKRAVGRAHLSPEDKDKVRAAIDKHFGVESTPAKASKKKKAAKKVSKKKAATKKTTTTAAKPKGRKKVAKKAKKKAAKRPQKTAHSPDDTVVNAEMAASNSAVSDKITLLGSVVANAVAGIQALDFGQRTMQGEAATLDIQEGVKGAGQAITNAMKQLGKLSAELGPEEPEEAASDDGPSEEELLQDPTTVHSPPGAADHFTKLVSESNKADAEAGE